MRNVLLHMGVVHAATFCISDIIDTTPRGGVHGGGAETLHRLQKKAKRWADIVSTRRSSATRCFCPVLFSVCLSQWWDQSKGRHINCQVQDQRQDTEVEDEEQGSENHPSVCSSSYIYIYYEIVLKVQTHVQNLTSTCTVNQANRTRSSKKAKAIKREITIADEQ